MTNQEFFDSLLPIEKPLVQFYIQTIYEKLEFDGGNILEIGSGWGLFTRSACSVSANNKITTIDKIDKLEVFDKNTKGYENQFERFIGDSKTLLPKFIAEKLLYDVIFIDGDHGYEGFKSDLELSVKLLKKDGLLLVDDVWHRKNFENDYGILKALSEFCLSTNSTLEVFPKGHGVAIIKLHNEN